MKKARKTSVRSFFLIYFVAYTHRDSQARHAVSLLGKVGVKDLYMGNVMNAK